MKVKVSEYIADFLVENGIKHNFTVTGGGAMHLNDALGHKEGMQCIYNNHEQASAMAAEAYSRLTGRIACLCVTSGPGGTNAITGVLGGWLDSIPMFVLSGQVKRELTIANWRELNLRQLGDQEFDICSTVRNFTKYAVMINDKMDIAYQLEKALFLCRQEKGGPVWLDIPLDIQGDYVDTNDLRHFNAEEEGLCRDFSFDILDAERLLKKIEEAKAPVLLAGSSIQYSGAQKVFLELVQKLKIPVVPAWAANDVLAGDSPYCIGVPGTLGTRAGNFVIQKCDLLISLGCRMNVRMVGYTKGDFAKNAYKIMVEISKEELSKPTYIPDWGICADVKDVIEKVNSLEYTSSEYHESWLEWCQDIKKKYPVVIESYHNNSKKINPYIFTEKMYEKLSDRDTIVCSNGSACVIPIQVNGIKQGQRMFCNSGCAAMGYGLPAAIGAAVALDGNRVICLEGDGSIMMNIQEIPTAKLYELNVKIIIYNNNGYHSIRQTQSKNFKEPFVGINRESGVAIPKFKKVAEAFDIPYFSIMSEKDLKEVLDDFLSEEGIGILEVFVDEEQAFEPKSSVKILGDGSIISPSIDDMAPFLPREEYEKIHNSWVL